MSAREKIAYIRGLLDAGTPREAFDMALHRAIVDALDAVVDQVEDQEECLAEMVEEMMDLVDYCEAIGEDLGAIQEDLDDLEDYDDDELDLDPDEDLGQMDLYESILCPFCSTMFYYRPDLFQEDDLINCPNCKRTFAPSEVELEED